jgi:type II secretory pathway pseudopilin PulG
MSVSFKKTKKQAGQSLIEVIVATGMVGLVLTAIVAGIALGIRNSRFSKNQSLATRFSQEALEWTRLFRDEVGWQPFYNSVSGDGNPVTYCFSQIPADFESFDLLETGTCDGVKIQDPYGEDTEFEREVEISLDSNPPQSAVITVIVAWQEGSKIHQSQVIGQLHEWDQ